MNKNKRVLNERKRMNEIESVIKNQNESELKRERKREI
jgi:hypothetical protein